MAKIVVVTSGKGGVGKTTTSAAFSSGGTAPEGRGGESECFPSQTP